MSFSSLQIVSWEKKKRKQLKEAIMHGSVDLFQKYWQPFFLWQNSQNISFLMNSGKWKLVPLSSILKCSQNSDTWLKLLDVSLTLAAFSGLGFHLLNRSQHIVYSGPQLRQHSGIPFPGLALSLPSSPTPTLWDSQKHSSSLDLAYVHSNRQFHLNEILYDSTQSTRQANEWKIITLEVCHRKD